MNLVEIPSKGDGLRAEWGESVARSINAFGPAASPGSLPFTTHDGHVGFSPLPANKRERRVRTADTGCFRIVGIDGLDVTFANCYLTVGGKFHDIGEVPEDEDEPQIAVATVTLESDKPFLVIQLDAQSGEFAHEFAQFETSADLESDCEDPAHFNLPLYEFNIVETEEGSGEYTVSVKADLRNIPTAPMMEI